MAGELNKEIRIKIILDGGQELATTMKISAVELKKLQEAAAQISVDGKKIKPGMDTIKSEVVSSISFIEQRKIQLEYDTRFTNMSLEKVKTQFETLKAQMETLVKFNADPAEIERLSIAMDSAKARIESLTASTERPLLKNFASDLLNIEASSEEAVQGIMQFIQYNELSEKEIEQVINALRTQQLTFGVGTKQYIEHGAAIANLTNASHAAAMGQQKFSTQSGSARMAISQMGFALGDASMIMVNFRMFLMGIGNNIPFVVQGLAKVAEEAKAANMGMGQYLKTNMDMSAKLVLSANAAMFALMFLPAIFEAINKESGEAAKEGLERFNKELEKMTSDQVAEKLDKVKTKIKQINDEKKSIQVPIDILSPQFSQMDKIRRDTKKMETEEKEPLSKKTEEALEQAAKLRGKLELEVNNIEALLDQLPSFGGITDEDLVKNLKKYVDSTDDIMKVNQELVNQKESIEEKLQDLDKSSETREKEKAAAEKKRLQESKQAADERKKKDEEKFKSILQEIQLEIRLAELANGDVYAEKQKGIATVNEQLKNQNLTLEREIELRELLVKLNDKDKEFEQERIAWLKQKGKGQKEADEFANKQKEAAANLKKEETGKRANLITNPFERERQLAENAAAEDLDFYKTQLDAKLIAKEDYERMKLLIQEEYDQKSRDLDREAFLYKISTMAQLVSTAAQAYDQIYNVIEGNVRAEIGEWKNKEEEKLEAERDTALKSARTQAQKEKINERFDKRRDALAEEANDKARERLAAWFYINQAVSGTSAIIASIAAGLNTMELLSKYLPPPFPQIAMGTTIAAGLAQAYVISQQKLPGFDQGGKLIPGKPGVFEGNQIEVVAPEKTFLDVMRNEYMPALLKSAMITMSLMNVKEQIRSGYAAGGYVSGGDADLLREVKLLNANFKRYAENPVSPIISKAAVGKIYRDGSAQNRRTRI